MREPEEIQQCPNCGKDVPTKVASVHLCEREPKEITLEGRVQWLEKRVLDLEKGKRGR